MHSVPHSSKPECVDVNYLKSLVQKVQGSILQLVMSIYLFKTRTGKPKKTSQLSVVSYDEIVHVVQCNSIKCKKRNHKYCFKGKVIYFR